MDKNEQKLYDKICEILIKNNKEIPTGIMATTQVGLMLYDIQKSCEHSNGYEVFVDPEGVSHNMCVDCLAEKE